MKIFIYSLFIFQSCSYSQDANSSIEHEKISMQSERYIHDDIDLLRKVSEKSELGLFQKTSDSLISKWTGKEEFQIIVQEVCNNLSSKGFEPRNERHELLKKYSSIGLFDIDNLTLNHSFSFLNHFTYANVVLNWSENQNFEKERAILTEKWLKNWQILETDKEVDFNFNDLPELNVPPPERANSISGVDPKEIEDPELRKEYELAIEKNRIKTENFNYQKTLVDLENMYRPQLISYFKQNYAINEAKVVEDLLNSYAIDDRLNTEILAALN